MSNTVEPQDHWTQNGRMIIVLKNEPDDHLKVRETF